MFREYALYGTIGNQTKLTIKQQVPYMKKIIVVVLFFLTTNLFPQTFDLGIGHQSYILGNSSFSFGPIGLKLHGKYNFNKKLSSLSNVSFMYFTKARNSTVLYRTHEITLFQLEQSALYHFSGSKFKPYLGAGLGYYITRLITGGNVYSYRNNQEIWGESVSNSFGAVLHAGISDFHGVFVEFKFIIYSPTLKRDIVKYYENRTYENITETETVNFNSLFFNFGYEFALF